MCCVQSNYEYGFSFALLTAAWPLSWLSFLFSSIPWPYHPAAYDRSRYHQQPSAAASFAEVEEAQAAERQQALQAGGVGGRPALSERIWSAFGVSPEKRRGYAEKWGGQSGGGYAEAQERRQSGGRGEESLEEGRRLRGSEQKRRGEEQGVFGPSTGSSSSGSGGGGTGGGMSSITGTSLRPATSSTAPTSEQRAEPVPVRLHM